MLNNQSINQHKFFSWRHMSGKSESEAPMDGNSGMTCKRSWRDVL